MLLLAFASIIVLFLHLFILIPYLIAYDFLTLITYIILNNCKDPLIVSISKSTTAPIAGSLFLYLRPLIMRCLQAELALVWLRILLTHQRVFLICMSSTIQIVTLTQPTTWLLSISFLVLPSFIGSLSLCRHGWEHLILIQVCLCIKYFSNCFGPLTLVSYWAILLSL